LRREAVARKGGRSERKPRSELRPPKGRGQEKRREIEKKRQIMSSGKKKNVEEGKLGTEKNRAPPHHRRKEGTEIDDPWPVGEVRWFKKGNDPRSLCRLGKFKGDREKAA